MIIKKIYGSGHIREKQWCENYLFLAFYTLFYLKQPISLNLNKFEKNTPTEEKTDIAGIFHIYFWQIEHEIRAFRLKKFNNQVLSTPPPKFY